MFRTTTCALFLTLISGSLAHAQSREEKLQLDRKKFENDPRWIYNDLPRGFAEAKKTGKPILVVLRCIPCHECVKLDDDLVNEDKVVKPLLDKYVCVRVVSTNGLDLSLFQFDYDQSFAAFLLSPEGDVYGRFGTRSHRTAWEGDVSIEGFAEALKHGLLFHRDFPMSKAILEVNRGPAPAAASPELLPSLKGKYGPKLATEGKVVQSCIHCHQIGDALRQLQRAKNEPFDEKVLFPYPHPKILGMIVDPKTKGTLLEAVKGSPADKAGLGKGDEIQIADGHPIGSIADLQWALHRATGDSIVLSVRRAKFEPMGLQKIDNVKVELPKDWRQRDDLSWRSSTWGLRRMATGGMFLEAATPEDRAAAKVANSDMALRAKHVGQFGPHAAAQNAGFRKGDVVVSFDGRTDLRRETDVIAHALRKHRPGDRVPVTIVRDGKKMDLWLPMQR